MILYLIIIMVYLRSVSTHFEKFMFRLAENLLVVRMLFIFLKAVNNKVKVICYMMTNNK